MINKKNQKHIKFRGIHLFLEQNQDIPGKKTLLELLKEWLSLILAATGVFTALLYLVGRSYASGYFSAMNIPNYHVSFSLWEYGEVAWIQLIFYPAVMLAISSIIWGIVFLLINWVKHSLKIKPPSWKAPEFIQESLFWFEIAISAIYVCLLAWMLFSGLQHINNQGKAVGLDYILKSAPEIELTSATPLALDETVENSSNKDYFVYKELHLLTFNNGKYYLFKEIDQTTCKPTKVYVVDSEKLIQVNLLPAVSLVDQCPQSGASSTTTTLTATPAP